MNWLLLRQAQSVLRVTGLEDDIPEGYQHVTSASSSTTSSVSANLTSPGPPLRAGSDIPGASLVPPPGIALPNSALCVALLDHASLVSVHGHVVAGQNGGNRDSLSVHVLACAVVEVEVCV